MPTVDEARKAFTFQGRVNEEAASSLLTGKYATISSKVIAQDVIKQWRPKTIEAKEIAVRAFFAFLTAIGALTTFSRRMVLSLSKRKPGSAKKSTACASSQCCE